MKVFSMFSGIGAFEKALDRLKAKYELVGFSEIDKYAVKSYCAIHGVDESKNLGDITKIDEKALQKDIDLITYGFPCQDISIAGKQKGLLNEDGTQTRSGLFFEALRIIEETKPRVAIAENVKNLTGKRFKEQFQIVLDSLEATGYNNYWQVLNATSYGIPQNRERVFIVSIRKDIDTGFFKFPEGFPLELRLKDILEEEVDEKYYISEKTSSKLAEMFDLKENCLVGGSQKHQSIKEDGISTTLTARMGTGGNNVPMYVEPSVKQIGNCCPTKTRENPNQGRIYDTEGLAPCLNQMGGGNRQPFVVDGKPTIQTYLRIRKLTPKECFRLMGFDDEDFEKAEAVNSNTQLYRQAGNSIVVPVVEYIIEALFECGALEKEREEKEMELKMIEFQQPKAILFNYNELKSELEQRVKMYETLVYTDDQIQEAKKDKAALNKLKKALNDERIRLQKEYMQPFNDFKAKIDELISIIDTPVALIDKQVKEYDEIKKQEKKAEIEALFRLFAFPTWVTFEMIFDEKWLNSTVSMKSIQTNLEEAVQKIEADLATLSNLPEFGFEATDVYKQTLNLQKAIQEGQRLAEIQKRKAEQERLKAEQEFAQHMNPPEEPLPFDVDRSGEVVENPTIARPQAPRTWIGFKANLTVEEAMQLKNFFECRGIEFEQIAI